VRPLGENDGWRWKSRLYSVQGAQAVRPYESRPCIPTYSPKPLPLLPLAEEGVAVLGVSIYANTDAGIAQATSVYSMSSSDVGASGPHIGQAGSRRSRSSRNDVVNAS
jgi:hypothetical protein